MKKELQIKNVCQKGSSNLKQKDVEGTNGVYPVFGASGKIGNIGFYQQENEYIAIVKDGSGIGRVAFMPPKSSVIGTMQYILPKEGYDIKYIGYCLQSLDLSAYKQGAAIPHIYFRDYGERNVRVETDKKAQQQIVKYLDTTFEKIDRIKEKAEKKIEDAKGLFQAALNEKMKVIECVNPQKIGDVFLTYSGGTPLKQYKEYYENGNIPWLNSGEVSRKYISKTDKFITKKGLDNSSAKYYPIDTVVVAMYGATAAQAGILKIRTTSNQAVCGILPHKNFVPEFVYYWFRHKQKYLASQAQGGAQPNISQIKIKNILIPTIRYKDQQQIVTDLDALNEKTNAIEHSCRQIISECDNLKQAILKQVFE